MQTHKTKEIERPQPRRRAGKTLTVHKGSMSSLPWPLRPGDINALSFVVGTLTQTIMSEPKPRGPWGVAASPPITQGVELLSAGHERP